MSSAPKMLSGLLYSNGKLVRASHRKASEIRPIEITPDFISSAEGSALIRLGETRVICTASVESGVPAFLKGTGKGWISSEYAMIPARHGFADAPRSNSRTAQRPDHGNTEADWPVIARHYEPGKAGRKDRLD